MQYIAHFQAKAWIRDYAVEVDAEGETDWDCTEFVNTLDEELRKAITTEAESDGWWVDCDDLFKGDPAAPAWIRDWRGPFTISVKCSSTP